MSEAEQDAKITAAAPEVKKLDLSSLPEKSNVHIHMASDEPVYQGKAQKDMSKRTLVSIISGGVGAVLGYIGSKVYINQKMFDFDTEVLDKTKSNILGRAGLGASVAESGLGGAGLAAGFSSGEIHMANASKLAQSGQYGAFPKFIYKTLGGPEGKSIVALAGAAAVGTVAAVVAYNVSGSDTSKNTGGGDQSNKDKDWADKVVAEKDLPRTLS